MIWHIVTKEIYHNLTTLRFALMLLLLPLLMLANALIYGLAGGGWMAENNAHQQRVSRTFTELKTSADESLAELAIVGPGLLSKRPSPLKFCADGADEVIPTFVRMKGNIQSSRSGYGDVEPYAWRFPWTLEYPLPSESGHATQRIKLDWVFIGILMSFFTILFTFDAIAGERARGTLSLILSNPVSRGQVLFAKYLGAFLTLMVPLAIGILMNLLVLLLTKSLPLAGGEWLRLLGMGGLMALLVSSFICLGLFVSSRVSNAITSLVWLLLTWVCLAFAFPSLLGTFVGNLQPIPSVDEVSLRKKAQLAQIEAEFRGADSNRLKKAPSAEAPEATRRWATYFLARRDMETQMADAQLDRQFRQVQLARDLTQFSPIACFQQAMEGLANTGIGSYMNFVKQARRYRQTFTDFVKTEDRSDPGSLHIYPVKEGLSQKPVNPKAVPQFKEELSHESVLRPVGLLILFNALFFSLAQISFLKSDVK